MLAFSSTRMLSFLVHQYQASMMATPIMMPGTMPAMNSLVIETPPVTPKRMKPMEGGMTGAMMPPQEISPQERLMS